LRAAAQPRAVGIVGGVDRVEAEACTAQLVERRVQVADDTLGFAQAFLAGFFAAGFFAAGLAPAWAGLASAFAAGVFALASAGFAACASFSGLAGLGFDDDFSTGPLAGSSGWGAASPLSLDAFLAFAVLAGGDGRARSRGRAHGLPRSRGRLRAGPEWRSARRSPPSRRGSRRPCPRRAAHAAARRPSAPAGRSGGRPRGPCPGIGRRRWGPAGSP